MTTYTTIANSEIDQDSPVTQTLMTALRDNPIAITEGSAGAPKINPSTAVDWAVSTNTAAEQTWVGNRYAGVAALAIGSHLFARYEPITNESYTGTPGSLASGSKLNPAGLYDSPVGAIAVSLSIPGTWRCLGYVLVVANTSRTASLWVRVS